jgi:phospholipase C
MKDLEKFKPLVDHLNKTKEHKIKDIELNETFDKVITLKVSEETFEAWELLCENWGDVLGYDNKSKIFEFAIIEALNVPIASLGGFNI